MAYHKLSAAVFARVTSRYTSPCATKARFCTRTCHRYPTPCGTKTRNYTRASRTHCLGRPYCTGACISNALPRTARIRALSRLPVTPGGRALVFRTQYNSVIHRARLRGANRHEHERLTSHTRVTVMTLARGGNARGKPFPGNLSVCA